MRIGSSIVQLVVPRCPITMTFRKITCLVSECIGNGSLLKSWLVTVARVGNGQAPITLAYTSHVLLNKVGWLPMRRSPCHCKTFISTDVSPDQLAGLPSRRRKKKALWRVALLLSKIVVSLVQIDIRRMHASVYVWEKSVVGEAICFCKSFTSVGRRRDSEIYKSLCISRSPSPYQYNFKLSSFRKHTGMQRKDGPVFRSWGKSDATTVMRGLSRYQLE